MKDKYSFDQPKLDPSLVSILCDATLLPYLLSSGSALRPPWPLGLLFFDAFDVLNCFANGLGIPKIEGGL